MLLPVPIGGIFGDVVQLADPLSSADRFALAEKSDATRLAYRTDFRLFTTWCDGRGFGAMPATPQTVRIYLAWLADSGLSAATVSRRAAAIKYAHELKGHAPPTNDGVVRATIRGIRRTIRVAPDQKAPATASVIAELLAHVPAIGSAGLRDRAILLVGFGAALRRSELVGLDVEDLEFGREGVRLHLGRTKTDQEGAGEPVAIPNGSKLKPVSALRAWLEAAAIAEGPVFRRILRGGRVSADRLSGRAVALIVKRYAGPAGFDLDEFAGHSLRAGFVTSALEDGADILKVMDQTRHREVRTLKGYDRRAKAFRNHAGKGFL